MEYFKTLVAITGISLLAALPLQLAMVAYLQDVNSWNVELSYGLIYVVAPVSFAIFVGLAYTEVRVRRFLFSGSMRFPWLSMINLLGMCTFFSLAGWAEPFVLQQPEWCRVSQSVHWQSRDDLRLVLVLGGSGNLNEHTFKWGYLNSSDGLSDIPAIELRPIRFGGVNASSALVQGTLLKSNVGNASLDPIAEDIWRVLQMANNGNQISSTNGIVDPIYVAPDEHSDAKLGGVVWMLCLSLLFVITGQLSLRTQSRRSR